MTLVQFTSDRGRGHLYSPVYVNPSQVAAVEGVTDARFDDNRTTITLVCGSIIAVRERPSEVEALLTPPGTV